VLVEIGCLLGDAADHDAITEHVEDIELARVSQELFRNAPGLSKLERPRHLDRMLIL
jgi:hypothetical protein